MTIGEYKQYWLNNGEEKIANAVYNYFHSLKKEGLLWTLKR